MDELERATELDAALRGAVADGDRADRSVHLERGRVRMSREEMKRRRAAVSAVHDIVSAMRAIAAGRIQGAQRALVSARQYHAIVMRGIAVLLAGWELPDLSAHPSGPTALLIMTSEQPFCGAFNQNLLTLAEGRWNSLNREEQGQLMVVGQRGLRQLLAGGLVPDHGEPAATSLEGIHDLVKRLAILVGRHYASGEIRSLRVIYNRYQSISEQIPTEVQILPPDLASVGEPGSAIARPFCRYLSERDLLAGLIDEYAFISLYLLAVESYTSEQASRLVAMDSLDPQHGDHARDPSRPGSPRSPGPDHPRGPGPDRLPVLFRVRDGRRR